MKIYLFDGSFEGLMCVFLKYYQEKPLSFKVEHFDSFGQDIFGDYQDVILEPDLADRILNRLKKRIKSSRIKSLYHVFLSEDSNCAYHILRVLEMALDTNEDVFLNLGNPSVLYLSQLHKKVHREKHRMEAFIRFREMKDGLFAAIIEPDFNVLPIISDHFAERYADQHWLIYDVKRKYGIYYNLREVQAVELDFDENAFKSEENWDEDEALFQTLWKNYFRSTAIKSRKNSKLHIQHMPKRYWKYLTEKER